jgi:integrase
MKKFNPKEFQGKKRIYVAVQSAAGISKLWIWNEVKKEYEPPLRGKSYLARKSLVAMGKKISDGKFFYTLHEARDWQCLIPNSNPVTSSLKELFKDTVERWKAFHYPSVKIGTRGQYDKLLKLYFSELMNLETREITSTMVNEWVHSLKQKALEGNMYHSRTSFKKELNLLSLIFNFVRDYDDSNSIFQPVKRLHYKASIVREKIYKNTFLKETDFLKFLTELKKQKNGDVYFNIAIVQFYQSLRASEVCAIHAEDVRFDLENLERSSLNICRSMLWLRTRDSVTKIVDGFKNSKSIHGQKTLALQMFPFHILQELLKTKEKGPLFTIDDRLIEYRWMQYAYDKAFKAAGLKMKGTHLLRHGGASRIYNVVPDLTVVGPSLGNKSISATQVYAHRDEKIMFETNHLLWEIDSKKKSPMELCHE